MKNEKPIVTAKRIKIPILEGATIYITFCLFLLFVLAMTPLVNLVLKNVFYDYIHIGKYFYIICLAIFLLSFIKIIAIIIKNNIHNKKQEDCIIESLYDLYIYDKKVYHIQKENIVSFTFVPKYQNYDQFNKNLCVGNHIIKYKSNNKVVKIILYFTYKV